MKKLLGILLLMCTGCFTAAPPDTARLALSPVPAAVAPPRSVTADQVTAQNAHQVAKALAQELDREDAAAPR